MKTLTDQFIEMRNRPQSVGTVHKIYLTEFELDGTQLDEYDITDYLKGDLPLIEKEVEKYFNAFVTGEATLKFFDPEKYIDGILNQTNRKFGLKITLNFDGLEVTVSHASTTALTNAMCECVHGDYLYIGCTYEDFYTTYIAKYLINSDGTLTLITKHDITAELGDNISIYQIKVTDNYIYIATGKGLGIYDHNFNLIGSAGSNPNLGGLIISDDELHAWGCASYSTYNNLYYYNLSNKAHPTQTVAKNTRFFQQLTKSGNYLFVSSLTGSVKRLSVFDVSSPGSTPYTELKTVVLTGTDSIYSMYTHELSKTLYYSSNSYFGIIDITTPSNFSVISETSSAQGIPIVITNIVGQYIFGIGYNKVRIGDTIDYRSIEALYALDYTLGASVPLKNLTIDIDKKLIFYAAKDTDKIEIFKYTDEDILLFDGIVDIQRKTRKGRNEFFVTAQTWEKELEHYNAELVFDTVNLPCRNITGVGILGIIGGQPGVKTLKYKYHEDDAGNLYEFQYDDGPSVLLEEKYLWIYNNVTLYNKTKEQILYLNFMPSKALKEDAEDIFIVGYPVTITNIGYWYQAEDIENLVNKLLDRTNITIPEINRLIDVNEDIGIMIKEEFLYFHKTTDGTDTCGAYAMADTNNKVVSNGTIFVCGNRVFAYTWSKTDLSFSKTLKFSITDYLSDSLFVEKILSDNYGNHFLICVQSIEGLAENVSWSNRKYYRLSGVVKVDSNGDYVTHWAASQMDTYPSSWTQWLLAKSFSWTSILTTGKLAYEEFQIFGDRIISVHAMVFDTDTGTIVGDEERGFGLAEGYEFGQGIAIKWNLITEEIDEFWVMEYREDEQTSRLIWNRPQLDTSDWRTIPEMDYGSSDIYGQFQSKDVDNNWCLYSKPGESSEERRQFFFTFDISDTIFPTEYWTAIAITNILNYGSPPFGYISGWKLDDNGFQEAIVKIDIETAGILPNFEIIQSGFLGSEFKMYSAPYYDGLNWIGISTAGYSNTLIVWTVTNISKNIIQIANFQDLNVRQALDEIAVLMCYWKRPERDKALFYSRGNYNDTAELDWDAYIMDDRDTYLIGETKPYIGAKVSNPLYSQYIYKHPDNLNDGDGEIFELSNRFIFPINGYVMAKLLADWHGQIRKVATIPTWFRIELEELDRILWKLYDIDGNLEEQIYMLLNRITYNPATKLTELEAIKLEGVPVKTIKFRPRFFATV